MKLKLKYFIRGLGIGILFTAIAMSLSLQASRSRIIRENALTKDEIMEKAMGYGMIMDTSEDTNSVEEEPLQDEQSQQEITNQENSQNDEESQNVVDSQSDEENQNDDSLDEESNKVQDDNEKDDSIDEDKDDSKKDDSIISIDYYSIEITDGMTGTSVGRLLKEKNIIEDSDEFLSYMHEQGYSNKIRTGEYLIPVNATYKSIAEIITGKK